MKTLRLKPPFALHRVFHSVFVLLGAAALAAPLHAATTNSPAPTFGFSGPEVFPIENFMSDLRAADLDGDGLNDLIVVNNARSKITLLFNQTGRTNKTAAPTVRTDINDLPPDARFRIDSIASEKRIASLAVGDLNKDGRPDIAYYGEPRELVVQYNLGTNGWSSPKRWPIEDGQLTQNGLVTGDLNGDGRADLLLLAENHVYHLAQQKDGSLAEPEKIPFASPVKAVHASSAGMPLARKRRSWQIELPHIGLLPAGTYCLSHSTTLASASPSVTVEALTRSISPLLPCVPLFQASIASSVASLWWIANTGPAMRTASSGSVTTTAISMMRSRSG